VRKQPQLSASGLAELFGASAVQRRAHAARLVAANLASGTHALAALPAAVGNADRLTVRHDANRARAAIDQRARVFLRLHAATDLGGSVEDLVGFALREGCTAAITSAVRATLVGVAIVFGVVDTQAEARAFLAREPAAELALVIGHAAGAAGFGFAVGTSLAAHSGARVGTGIWHARAHGWRFIEHQPLNAERANVATAQHGAVCAAGGITVIAGIVPIAAT
jgi:hypothetical protein